MKNDYLMFKVKYQRFILKVLRFNIRIKSYIGFPICICLGMGHAVWTSVSATCSLSLTVLFSDWCMCRVGEKWENRELVLHC